MRACDGQRNEPWAGRIPDPSKSSTYPNIALMKKILVFSGSNSSKSINTKIAEYAARLVAHHQVKVIDLRDYPLPIYSRDIEKNEGIPANVLALKALFDEHDGFIIALPEHNNSFSAFFKNTIDWISREHVSFFEHKPIALLAASPGPGGGRSVLAHAQKVLSGYLAGKVVGTVSVARFHQNTESREAGGIIVKDEATDEAIMALVQGLERDLMGADAGPGENEPSS